MYNITDLIQAKLVEAGCNNVSYGTEGEFNIDAHNLLPLGHVVLNTSQSSNFNQVSFSILIADVLASTSVMDVSEMTNPFNHVSNLIDIQHDLNIKGLKFIRLIYNSDSAFYQRLDNTPVMQWEDDLGRDRLVGYTFELVFNLDNVIL